MNRAEKEAVIKSLVEDFNNAKAVFLTNLIGIPSNDANEIRKNVRDAKGKLVVTKNTLFAKATSGTDLEEFFTGLKGPNAVAFAFEDAAAIAKCLKNASKDHEVIEFKKGVLDGKVLSSEELKQLADLPSRDEMLATLLATFNAPVSAFARVLFAIQEQKEQGGEAAPVEEAAATEETTTEE